MAFGATFASWESGMRIYGNVLRALGTLSLKLLVLQAGKRSLRRLYRFTLNLVDSSIQIVYFISSFALVVIVLVASFLLLHTHPSSLFCRISHLAIVVLVLSLLVLAVVRSVAVLSLLCSTMHYMKSKYSCPSLNRVSRKSADFYGYRVGSSCPLRTRKRLAQRTCTLCKQSDPE
jgi:hypothetical protein